MNPFILASLAALLFCGCAHFQKPAAKHQETLGSGKSEIRNNAASLLYELLGDEKDVSKILIIKRNSDELGRLIKSVSAAAAVNYKQLKQLAAVDPTLNLNLMALPPGEKAARAAIAKTKERELLSASGREFEFKLLLTQAEALSYGWHLAKIVAENSSSVEQVQKFTALSQQLENLYGRVIARIHQDK